MKRRLRGDLLVGVLLVALGAAGLAWQVEGPSGASAAARPTLVCPLGTHGLAPPPFPSVSSSSGRRVEDRP